ncbi:uncharacterized protein [Nicotiana tomentosiformis]|uniref:uncharacterized protein n=1 Tax=Nicotiana tomentosiformis TaxID=4098 RepID=UPI00388C5F5F
MEIVNNFMVKIIHKCVETNRNNLCNSKYLAKRFRDRIIEQPNIRIFKFQETIRKELGIHVGKTTVRRARAKVLTEIMGDHIAEFQRIYDYRDEVLRTNPGSTCMVKVEERDANGKLVFQSFYVCFDALKKVFLSGCRNVLGLECTIRELLTMAEHRMCARHILANWSKKWRGIARRNAFWRCAKSTYEAELKKNLDELNMLCSNIFENLLYYNKERWCRIYFSEFSKCDVVENNMVECLNAWILVARHKTIITMLEEIRLKMMKRIAQLRDFSNTWIIDISHMALKDLQENISKSMKCTIHWNGEYGYEIEEGL